MTATGRARGEGMSKLRKFLDEVDAGTATFPVDTLRRMVEKVLDKQMVVAGPNAYGGLIREMEALIDD